jgi:LysR family nitrogen assimilation transcriptional regulator
MELHQLRYFVAVADKGSFSKGALRVGVAQSAVSLQVRRLEESLGVELFERTTSGATLTPAGRSLLEFATNILDQVALAEAMVPQAAGKRRIAIRLGVPSGIAQLLSVPLLRDIRETLPGIDLKIVEALSGDLQDQLAEGRLDMALLFRVRDESSETQGPFESVYLLQAYDGASLGAPLRMADLASIPLTMPSGRHQIRGFLAERAARVGLELDIQAELDGYARILQLVMAGKARAVMIASSFLREWHEGRLTARLIEDFHVEPIVVVGGARKVAGSRAIEAVRRRVEMLAHSVSAESARMSAAYLSDA